MAFVSCVPSDSAKPPAVFVKSCCTAVGLAASAASKVDVSSEFSRPLVDVRFCSDESSVLLVVSDESVVPALTDEVSSCRPIDWSELYVDEPELSRPLTVCTSVFRRLTTSKFL